MSDPVTYFAYGSNLCLPRLRFRVPGVQFSGIAVLHDYALHWHKRSEDGSGKCSIESNLGEQVWGGLFSIPAHEMHRLDRVEGLGHGYDKTSISVRRDDLVVDATTYLAPPEFIDTSRRPYIWYRDLVVCGARAHGLPVPYTQNLSVVESVPDSDEARRLSQRRFLCEHCR